MDMEIESKHKSEWAEAQKIHISVDLEAAAKQQLKFLTAVDRKRFLYEGPALQRAIYRYNAFWLPLLAKHSESQLVEGPLVVPLDCEWIWHCHRLNPIRYKSDCEDLYGRILDNSDVVSSTQGTCSRQTEEIWTKLYPEEHYELDLAAAFKEDISERILGLKKCTAYDLVSAVKRQSPFFYQVSRPHMSHDVFIEEALARYKGFLHIIRRNKEKSIRRFCVPTYDVDLMWHSHQLHPVSYCEDLIRVHGKVLEHDDMDSDRSKGQKLDNGFSGTTNQWEETFGKRYWRAGAMYRGGTPSPVTLVPFSSKSKKGNDLFSSDEYQNIVQVPDVKFVEVLLEFAGVRGLPESHKGRLSVMFSKSQPDLFFNAKQRLSILSESGEKMVASFNCEPKGELLFELVSYCPSTLPIKRKPRVLGFASLSLQDYLVPVSKLSDEKWLELVPSSGYAGLESICLRVGFSFTVPSPALYVLRMVRSRPFAKSSCLFPLSGRTQRAKSWTRIMTDAGTEVITLQMRSSKKERGKDNLTPRKEVIGITASGETCTVAEFMENGWSLLGSRWSLRFQKSSCENRHLCMLIGDRVVCLPLSKIQLTVWHFFSVSLKEMNLCILQLAKSRQIVIF